MLRFGIITEIKPEEGTARVRFDDDGTVTAPLPVLFLGSKGTLHYFPFKIETPVAVHMDEGDNDGVILGAVYTKEDPPDASANDKSMSLIFADGTKIIYDWDAKTLTVDGNADLVINATAKEVNITADVKITGKLEVTDAVTLDDKLDVTGKGTFSDEIQATGKIASDLEVEAGPLPIKLTLHKHSGVQPGGGVSGTPIP